MRILFATSEAAPFAKTGGLGDVAGSLPVTLKEKGVDARVVMPLYRCIPQYLKDRMKYINHIYIDMAWRKVYCGIFELEHQGCTFYFIDNEFYFNGDRPYGYIHEDCEKFIFFSKAVLSILPTIQFRPDVIHCNDWQTGAVPVFLDTFQDNPFYRGIKTVLTIHNLRFQGRWNFKGIKDVMGISDYYFTSDKLEYHKDANLLKGGMVYANKITTVSNTYAWEITTPEYGEGLDGLLNARRNDLIGIVNGISYTEWNPETDDMIFEHYNRDTVKEKKKINKMRLQEQCNLPVDENKFMIGIVSRLTDQKGFDLLASSLEGLCNEGVQIIILGTGDEKYENLFRHYAWKYPDKISANIYFSNDLSHKIYAACDAFLMPSRFEPCGLSQLISLRYGTIPIVRETGGLKDTVWPYNQYTGEGNGFSFGNYSANDMMYVIRYAMRIYYDQRDNWNEIIQHAMQADFSWNVSADKYIGMYQQLTGIYDLNQKKNDTVESEPVEKIEELPVDTQSTELTERAPAELMDISASVSEQTVAPSKEPESEQLTIEMQASDVPKPPKRRTRRPKQTDEQKADGAEKVSAAKKPPAKTKTTKKTPEPTEKAASDISEEPAKKKRTASKKTAVKDVKEASDTAVQKKTTRKTKTAPQNKTEDIK